MAQGIKHHPAYEPKEQAIVCPLAYKPTPHTLGESLRCERGFTRIGEFEVHFIQHQPTDAEAREWLTESGYKRFLKDKERSTRG